MLRIFDMLQPGRHSVLETRLWNHHVLQAQIPRVPLPPAFWLIRNHTYADRFHHAKEEDVLFKALIENGMPKDNSPVAAMLMEHDQGRSFISALEVAVHEAKAGRTDVYQAVADNALGYAALLRDHISKEDDILYPLAERVLPEAMRESILEGYQAAEAQADSELSDR